MKSWGWCIGCTRAVVLRRGVFGEHKRLKFDGKDWHSERCSGTGQKTLVKAVEAENATKAHAQLRPHALKLYRKILFGSE